MPEFTCVTFLSCDRNDLLARKVHRSEIPYVAGVKAIRLADPKEWDERYPLLMLPPEERNSASFPLVLNLTALAHAYADESWLHGDRIDGLLRG